MILYFDLDKYVNDKLEFINTKLYFKLTLEQLRTKQTREVIDVRNIIIADLINTHDLDYNSIADYFNIHRCTVYNAIKSFNNLIRTKKQYKQLYDDVLKLDVSKTSYIWY